MLTFVVSAREKLIGDHLLISEKENSISLVNLTQRFPSSLSSLVNLPSYFSVDHCTAFIIMALTVASASASISNMILSIMALTVAFAFTSMFNITLILCIVASIIIMALTLASASTSSSASAPSNSASTSSSASAPCNSASTSSSASAPSNSASTSSSASAPSNCRYDVFLNHYGDDVKYNFASHLYRRLHSHGLQVFLDQPELQRGEKIEPQIEGAIATASVQVAIFSPGYAKSKWCLDELVSMLRSNATVIPVFFKVKPSEVRRTNAGAKGLYAEAIANHEKKKRYTQARIADWREALAEASQIVGYELEKYEGDEGKLVDEVVGQVLKKARLAPLHVATHPTGLDEKLQHLTLLLEKQQNRGRPIILGITGPGGMGKTTLVKEFFNRNRSDYERCCFLAEVRDSAVRNNLTSLQGQLCKDLSGETLEMRNIPEGIGKLEHYCSRSQSLVILDDVDSNDQLDALLSPVKNRLPSSSLILVTSRDKSVLSKYAGIEESSIYHMTGLGCDLSQELFCWHSFNLPHPAEGYEELVGRFLYVCNGLPLSLKVIGSLLRFESPEVWEAQLRKLTQVLPLEIQNTLRISYDSLEDQEKEIFIDSACLFIGIKAETAIRVWFGSGWEGSLGLQTLQNKCLVEVDSEGCIKLHDHLRDLGRNLADKGPLGRGFRMWGATDNCFRNVRPQSTVRGISIVPQWSESSQSLRGFSNDIDVDVNGLQLLRAPVDCLESLFNRMRQPKLVWLRCEIYSSVSLPSWISSNNSESSLPSWIPLKDLRVLEVVDLKNRNPFHRDLPVLRTLWPENKAQLPLQLSELNISAKLWQLPKSIGQLKYLEKIELHDFKGTLPEGFFYLRSLKYLKLRARNDKMNQLSESFGNLKSLLHLDLYDSEYLQMLPSSLGNLTQLQHMDLSWCKGLQMLPPSLGDLRELQHLDLSWCQDLQMLPPSLGDLRELQHMDLSRCTSLKTLPESFMNLIRLKYLDLSHCSALTLSGEIFGNIGTLIRLNLSGCHKLEELPHQVTHQQHLKELILDGSSNLKELPSAIGNLGNLEILSFSDTVLETLPPSFGKLKNLKELRLCVGKLDNFLDFAGQLKQLTSFSLSHSPISEVPFASVDMVQAGGRRLLDNCMLRLKSLDLSSTRITEISFGGGVCPALERLYLADCENLVKVGALPTSLTSLRLCDCGALRNITGLRDLKELRFLDMSGCREVEELSILGVWELNNLEELKLYDCPISVVPFASVEEVQGARRLSDSSIHNCMPRLKSLDLAGTRITEISFDEGDCPVLQFLHLWGMGITEISFGEGVCPALEQLDLSDCDDLVEVGALPASLKSLCLPRCGALKRITGLSGLEQLKFLDISGCGSIEELPGLETLISLKSLCADNSMYEDYSYRNLRL